MRYEVFNNTKEDIDNIPAKSGGALCSVVLIGVPLDDIDKNLTVMMNPSPYCCPKCGSDNVRWVNLYSTDTVCTDCLYYNDTQIHARMKWKYVLSQSQKI